MSIREIGGPRLGTDGNVVFTLMCDRVMQIFAIEREALEDLAGVESLSEDQRVVTYKGHRERIHAVASKSIGQEEVKPLIVLGPKAFQ